MAFIDFSLDSRIRKKYVPLTNQQRFMRHVKRVAARNLFIPTAFVQSLIDKSPDSELKNLNLTTHEDSNSNDSVIDDFEENQSLISRLNIAFYFTVLYPPTPECTTCLSHKPSLSPLCKCNQVLYRSELIVSANPSWRPFEGSTLCSPSISHFIIRVYYVQLEAVKQCSDDSAEHVNSNTLASNNRIRKVDPRNISNKNVINNGKSSNDDYDEIGTLLLEWNVNLSGLIFIGEEIPKDRRLTKNTIIFGLHEGFYTSLCSVTSEDMLSHIIPPTESMQIRSAMARDSYCMNTLTRIQMMQYIYQATAVEVQRVKNSLEEAIDKTKTKRELSIKLEKMQSSFEFLTEVLTKRRQRLASSQDRLSRLENEIFELNTDMSNRIQVLKEEINRLLTFRSEKLVETRKRLEYVRNALVHRRRVLAKELFQDIYRIIPFPDFRGYSICGIYLPDAEHIDEHDPKMISIALGYVTHLLSMLSSLLDINLNYQLIFYGSRSLIIDPNNQVLRENEKLLPLHSRSGRNAIFFKYGLYLLNRTIGYIRRSVGMKTQSVAVTLANLYTLFTECLLVDNYNINNDHTLNRFTLYSPSFDLIDPDLLVPNSSETFNQHFLNDINIIKDNDCMNDCLWKEVEALTLSVALNRTDSTPSTSSSARSQRIASMSISPSVVTTTSSSSSGSSTYSTTNPLIDEIKQNISKQKQRRRTVSTQRLSQITSSLSSSYASASSTPHRIPSVVSPEEILRQRRVSTNVSFQPDSPTFSVFNPRVSHPVNTHRRIRSVSGYCSHPSSYGSTRSSFLHPGLQDPSRSNDTLDQTDKASTPRRVLMHNQQQLMSCSLDKGLNQLMRHASTSSITSSLSNNSELVNPNQAIPQAITPSSYLNVEMLDIRYGRVISDESRSIEENMKVLSIEPSQSSNSWLHASNHANTSNQEHQSPERPI